MGLLRLFLALGVAAGHAWGNFGLSGDPLFIGGRAVQIFYVISGFLIAMILDGKYANSLRGTWIFYSNRALKIFVPYLVVLAATIVASLLLLRASGHAGPTAAIVAEAGTMEPLTWAYVALTNLLLFGKEYGYLLIYRGGQFFFDLHAVEHPPALTQFSIIPPAWSLSVELTFYLVAPFILRRHFLLLAGLALFCQWSRFQAYHFGWYSQGTDIQFFPFELGLFLYGAVIYRARRFLEVGALLRGVIAFGLIIFLWRLPRYFLEHQYQLYALVGLLLPSLLLFTNRHRWDRWLGELSYRLYILHYPIIVFATIAVQLEAPTAMDQQILWPPTCARDLHWVFSRDSSPRGSPLRQVAASPRKPGAVGSACAAADGRGQEESANSLGGVLVQQRQPSV